MPVSQKQIEAVLRLPAPKRYAHFVKKVVGWRKVWGLYADGWALSMTDSDEQVFPLWPEQEYAELCASGDWSGYEAREIELEDFLNDLLPFLAGSGVHPGVFFVPGEGSIVVTIDQLRADLGQELSKYQ